MKKIAVSGDTMIKKKVKPPTLDRRKGEMTNTDKFLLVLVIVAGIASFFYAAISDLNNWVKAPLIVAILYVSGRLMAYFGRLENYHGIIMLRGEGGFSLMKSLSNHPKVIRALADLGLTLGFGLVYGFLVFKDQPRKFFIHLLLVGGFFLTLQSPMIADEASNVVVKVAGILGGLLLFGVSALAIQSLKILTVPGTGAGAALIVPGVTIPFWEGIIAIIIAATVHEIAHGVLAMVEKLEVKNSGVILFGILPIGAFVEPNEEKLAKLHIHKKRRILIAGTTSNFLFSILFTLLAIPLGVAILGYANGVQITSIVKDGASFGILQQGEVIHAVNGQAVANYQEFSDLMKNRAAGDKISVSTNMGEKSITLGPNGKLGIMPDNYYPESNLLVGAMLFVFITFGWVALINSALAIINLVPIFLTDGYRIVYEEAKGAFPSENDRFAKRVAIAAGVLSVLLLLINFFPNFR